LPLQKIRHHKNYSVALWKIKESFSSLIKLLDPSQKELQIIKQFKNVQRQKQNIAARILLNYLCDKKEKLKYHKHGAPYCNTFKHISISHSIDYCIIIGSKNIVGVDIQHFSEKINITCAKFASNLEIKKFHKNIEKLHFLWCAKESIFKTVNPEPCSFKYNILIDDVKEDGLTCGYYQNKHVKKEYSLYCKSFDNYFISIATLIK
tara:strand:- start:134 stop:751 length:618 start_codon:yes stop_codon:yes gene_type:complete